ncbi:cellulose biosynthesis protein BcsQ [Azospirillum brasilense]|uniref:Cellulose biosynthesis protein BcsQ n=1 Tax=Azospirillum brasilense TaxID=192 RepID=A0A560AMW2_AZOBR|nr:ParA family protein [Azospirillum brasilense]TWA61697.1 cellulose biosynthesis protein BcsQ [Azospirillum brasilense]
MTKIITLYNHKGGVSKTTTTFNLAHLLAELGFNTLVIDADPQCNISELMLAPTIADLDEKEQETGVEQALPGSSLLDIIKPRIEGDAPEINIDDADIVRVGKNLSLLRGDISLSDIEDALAEAHIQRFSNKTHDKRTYVAFADFLKRLGDKVGYDYILIDVGPSSGALTRTCFLACDGFFVPSAPDRFNVQAVGTLSSIVSRWIAEHSQIYYNFQSLGLPVARGKPKFLGVILQNFKSYGGKPKKSYALWMDRIPGKIESKLLPAVKQFSTSDWDLTCGLDARQGIVAKIPDFGSLAPLLQETGKPVFQLTPRDTRLINDGSEWAGKVWTQASERMDEYRAQLMHLVERLNLI